ncbi:MAG: guanylate kinase [Planctomycetes bacterium]|nr:guanylate kinase [Planctomycetota bacterium]
MSSSADRKDAVAGGRGNLVVISGPSGTGKTSICNLLLSRLPQAVWSISATTRPLRGEESAGSSYEYIDADEFARRRANDDFLESAEYCGHWYGTPIGPVKRWIAEGKIVITEIDVQGGMQIAARLPESHRIFVLPPDFESLKARLAGRRTESAEHMASRLEKADGEIAIARDSACYQHFVTNDVLDDTVTEIIDIITNKQPA